MVQLDRFMVPFLIELLLPANILHECGEIMEAVCKKCGDGAVGQGNNRHKAIGSRQQARCCG